MSNRSSLLRKPTIGALLSELFSWTPPSNWGLKRYWQMIGRAEPNPNSDSPLSSISPLLFCTLSQLYWYSSRQSIEHSHQRFPIVNTMSLTPFSWILSRKIATLSSSALSSDSIECRTVLGKISRLRSGKSSERTGWCGSTRQRTHGPRTRTAPQHLRYAKPTEFEVKDKEDGLFNVGAHRNIDSIVIHNTIHVQAVELLVGNLYCFIFCEFAVLFTVLEYLEAWVPAGGHDELPVVDQCVDPAEMEDCGCFHTVYL